MPSPPRSRSRPPSPGATPPPRPRAGARPLLGTTRTYFARAVFVRRTADGGFEQAARRGQLRLTLGEVDSLGRVVALAEVEVNGRTTPLYGHLLTRRGDLLLSGGVDLTGTVSPNRGTVRARVTGLDFSPGAPAAARTAASNQPGPFEAREVRRAPEPDEVDRRGPQRARVLPDERGRRDPVVGTSGGRGGHLRSVARPVNARTAPLGTRARSAGRYRTTVSFWAARRSGPSARTT